jgi:hypothetical protein
MKGDALPKGRPVFGGRLLVASFDGEIEDFGPLPVTLRFLELFAEALGQVTATITLGR